MASNIEFGCCTGVREPISCYLIRFYVMGRGEFGTETPQSVYRRRTVTRSFVDGSGAIYTYDYSVMPDPGDRVCELMIGVNQPRTVTYIPDQATFEASAAVYFLNSLVSRVDVLSPTQRRETYHDGNLGGDVGTDTHVLSDPWTTHQAHARMRAAFTQKGRVAPSESTGRIKFYDVCGDDILRENETFPNPCLMSSWCRIGTVGISPTVWRTGNRVRVDIPEKMTYFPITAQELIIPKGWTSRYCLTEYQTGIPRYRCETYNVPGQDIVVDYPQPQFHGAEVFRPIYAVLPLPWGNPFNFCERPFPACCSLAP
jgi:hypothetical protein